MDARAHVLVIDDDTQIRKILRLVLERTGHVVIEAPNGAAGMQLYRTQPTDLVITDLHMPDMNGLDIITQLLRDFPEARIIAMSGADGKARDLLTLAKGLGAARTIQKPFNLWELIETVREVLV